MKKEIFMGILVSLLIVCNLTFFLTVQLVRANPGTIRVPADYGTIQGAINAAASGDTIYVYGGIYYEHIVVNKAISLIGEGRSLTVVDGNGTGNVINVTGNNVMITGFTIQNSGGSGKSGIYVAPFVSYCKITKNTLTSNYNGITLCNVALCTISGNNVTGNSRGLEIRFYSILNTILENTIANNSLEGIALSDSGNNTIYNNNFIGNTNNANTTDPSDSWNLGYPTGGNHWSNYTGIDVRKGPAQNLNGSDGIGDTPHIISGANQDNYPLMDPWDAGSTRYPWLMFHGNLEHTGYSSSPSPNTNRTLWNYNAGFYLSYSSPAVVDGKVYVGSFDKNVYCLDASTGTRIWNYTTGLYVHSSPAVADGKVYVGSIDKNVYCLDASTGARIWNYTTGGYVYSSPAVADGKVYVGSDDWNVYCLNALTGTRIWNYTIGGDIFGISSPAIADDAVYIGSNDHNVYCLNTLTGARIWNYTTGGYVYSSPAVADGKVYVGSDDKSLYCLNALTGARIWNYTAGVIGTSSPAVVDGKVYIGSEDSNVYCLDALTGTRIWNYTTGDPVDSSPAVADGKVYIGSWDKNIYCLDALTGARIWNYATGGDVVSSPAVADGVVFVGSYDGDVYAFGNTIRVPEDFRTVQEAINAANPGATIWIAPGIYHESLIVNKPLSLLGRKGTEPVFEGGGHGTAVTIQSSAPGTVVAGLVITNYEQGIAIVDASNCKIYDTTISLMSQNGIVVEGSNAAQNNVWSNIFQNSAVAVSLTAYSTGTTVYKNIINPSPNGIGLNLESSGNIICANTIWENQVGIRVTAGSNTIYHNNFINNAGQTSILTNAYNKWDNDYPSGGNYWSSYTGSDEKSGPNQDQPGKDGINDTSYTIATNNVDRYPLMKPFNAHDIGIVNFYKSKTVVDQGYSMNISLTILDYGMYDETFTVECHATTTTVGTQIIKLTERNCTTVTFTWKTTGVAKGNYTMSAYAGPVQDETDTSDNSLTTGWIIVAMVGDITGPTPWVPDGKCDARDVALVASLFGANYPNPRYQPNADIVYDGKMNAKDVALVASRFGQKDP